MPLEKQMYRQTAKPTDIFASRGCFSRCFGVFLRSFLGRFYVQWDVLCTMQWEYAKHLHLWAQNYQSYPTLCKNKQPFFADKAVQSLQNWSKLTFEPVKVCSKWVFLEWESNKNHNKLANVEYVALQRFFVAVTYTMRKSNQNFGRCIISEFANIDTKNVRNEYYAKYKIIVLCCFWPSFLPPFDGLSIPSFFRLLSLLPAASTSPRINHRCICVCIAHRCV